MEMNNPLLWTMALTGVCAGVQAQTDVTEKYIQNADCSSQDGWTISKPKGGNGPMKGTEEFEYWIGTASNGEFNYSQKIGAKLPVGVYRLSADVYNSLNGVQDPISNGEVGLYAEVGGVMNKTIVPTQAGTTYSTYSVIFEIKSGDEEVTVGFKNFATMTARWVVMDNVKLEYLGVNASSAITNPAFNAANANGWTVNQGTISFASETNSIEGISAEFWREKAADNVFDLYQKLNIPEGKYTLVADLFNSLNWLEGTPTQGEAGMYVNAAGTTTNVLVPTSIEKKNVTKPADMARPYSISFTANGNEDVTIGFKNFETMTARWFVMDNVRLIVNVEDAQSALSQKLAIQINKMAGIGELDDWFRELTLEASELQNKINNLTFEDYKNYKEGNANSLSAEIDELAKEIDSAIANYNAKEAAEKAYTDMTDALASLNTYIEDEVGEEYKEAAQVLFDQLEGRADKFKADAAQAYAERLLGGQADNYAETAASIIEDIAAARTTIATGDKNAMAYATVSSAIEAAKTTYTNTLQDLFFALSAENNEVYGGLYLKALGELNIFNREISDVEAENEANKETASESSEALLQRLADAKAGIEAVETKYQEYKANHVAACADIKDNVQAKLDELDKDQIGDCAAVRETCQEEIDRIQGLIDDLQAAVDAAKDNCTILPSTASDPYFEGYTAQKQEILNAVNDLYNEVKPELDEYHAYQACLEAVEALQKTFDLTKSNPDGKGKIGVNDLVSDDDLYTVNGKYADKETAIQEAIDGYTAAIEEAYAERTAQNYKVTLDAAILATTAEIEAYATDAKEALENYNNVSAAVEDYQTGLDELKEIVETPAVVVGGAAEGTDTYGARIATLESEIKKITDAMSAAREKTGDEHYNAIMDLVANPGITAEIEKLKESYADDAESWNEAQLAKAQETMLNDAQARIDLQRDVLPENEYDAATYGKEAATLNEELADIKAQIDACEKDVEAARLQTPTEAIASLSKTVATLQEINTSIVALCGEGGKAEKVKAEYAAEKKAHEEALARINSQNNNLNGDGKTIKGVLELMTDASKQDEFLADVQAIAERIANAQTAIEESFAAETLRKDLEDTTDEEGETVEGITSTLNGIDADITELRAAATKATNNLESYNKLLKQVGETQNVAKAIEDARAAISAATSGTGETYFLGLADGYATELETLKTDIDKAYEANEADTKEAALSAEITELYENVTGLEALAKANQTAYDAQKEAYDDANETWTALLAEISSSDVSGAHEAALTELTRIKGLIEEYQKTINDAFAKGTCDTGKAGIESDMTEITNALSNLNASWKDAYLAAVTEDNAGRKENFDNAYSTAVNTYSEAVTLMAQLSRTSSAVELTDDLKALVGEEGIYSYAEKIRNLKSRAEGEYKNASESLAEGTVVLFDPEEKLKAEAEDLMASVVEMSSRYADAVNAKANETFKVSHDAATALYEAARLEIQDWDKTLLPTAFGEVKKILDETKQTASNDSYFATKLDGILLQLDGVEAMIAAEQNTLAAQQWNIEVGAIDALITEERAAIADFKPEGTSYAETYEMLVQTVEDAKAARAEVSDDELYAHMTELRGMLTAFTSWYAPLEVGKDEEGNAVYEMHTQVYIDAYNADKNFHGNDTAYEEMKGILSDVQAKLDALKAYVADLYVVNDDVVRNAISVAQNGVDNAKAKAEEYHNANVAATNISAIEALCQTVINAIEADYGDIVTQEHAAMESEINLLKLDYEQAVAALLPSGTEDTLDGYKEIIAAYSSKNNSLNTDFTIGKNDEDGLPLYELDEDGNQVLDENNQPIRIMATKEETKAGYLALEQNVATTRYELAEIYKAELAGDVKNELEAALAEVETVYNEVAAALEDSHAPVVAKYQPEADGMKAAIDNVRARIEETAGDQTILLYEPVIEKEISLIAQEYETLLSRIATMETPYDVNDAKYAELDAELIALENRLNSVVETASAYEYAATSEDYRQARVDYITPLLEADREAVEAKNATGTGLNAASVLMYAEEVATETADLEKVLAYWNAEPTIQALRTTLGATNLQSDKQYTPDDRLELESRKAELAQAIDNMFRFSNSVYNFNGYTRTDIDGNEIKEVGEDGVETIGKTYDSYMEAYAEVMAKAAELKESIATLAQDMNAKSYQLGDINRDGKVSVIDYTMVRNIVVGATEVVAGSPEAYAADVDGNGDINIGDVTRVANIIMWGNPEGENAYVAARRFELYAENLNMEDDVLGLAVEGQGTAQRIAISLDNARSYVGLQMDVTLPEGVRIVNETAGARVEGHDLLSHDNNGARRILISTLDNTTIGNSGVVVYLDVEVSSDYRGGNIEIGNVLCADADAHTYQVKGIVGGEATGITELNAVEKVTSKIYNIGGQMMDTLKKGINIIVNSDGSVKKVLKK